MHASKPTPAKRYARTDRTRLRKSFAAALLPGVLLCGGCSTTGRQIAYDHTVQIATRPVSGSVELGWRIKTFWTEELSSLRRRRISFPLLRRQHVMDPPSDPQPMDEQIMARWLERKTGPPVKGSARLLIGGDEFFPEFEEAIWTAQQRIDLKTYIFDNDDVAKEIADQLKERSLEIPIRILYDSLGTRLSWRVDAPSLPPGTIYEAPDMIRYLQTDSRIRLRRARHTFLTSEHSKYILIDNRVAYFGGMNIGREYRYDWRDAMFALEGPVVDALAIQFQTAWIEAGGAPLASLRTPRRYQPSNPGHGDLYLIETTPMRPHIYRGQLRAIRNAQQRIYIENPYLWNQEIIYQLCAAARRGVDVRVTLPRDVNHGIGISANKLTVRRLLEHGARVFIYPGMTHVKAAVFDQWACFGSANFDDLSLHKNYELNLFTHNPEIVRNVSEQLLERGQSISQEVFEADELTLRELFIARFAQYL